MGNLEYKGDSLKGDTDFVYNSLNQLIRSTFAGVETLYTYDDNGSLKTRKSGEKTITYDWENDGENRLVGVEIVEGSERTEIEYEYNENGIRVGQTVNGVETSYLIDELQPYAQVLEEYDASGNLQAAYTYGEDLIGRNGQFYHKDGLGSTRLLSDENGEVLESYHYDAYGNLIGSEVGDTSHLFAGEQRDSLTGLDYLRARYYDPTLGRFISRDAYQGSLNDPMSQHKYQYAHANPVVNTDPTGYFSLGQIAATLALHSTLAGLSFTTGAAGAVLAGGGSFSDAVALYDQFFAGMLDSLTFGISTFARRQAYKETAVRNHRGLFFNLGRFAGTIAGAWIGSLGTTFAAFSKASWVGKAALGYDLFGVGAGVTQSLVNYINKESTWLDILAFVPFLTWLGVNYRVTRQGLSFGVKNLNITPGKGVVQKRLFTPDDADELLNLQEPPIVLELFGGAQGKVPDAVNIDLVAEIGIKADILKDKLRFVPDNSVDEIITFNPFIPKEAGGTGIKDYLPEAARVLKPGGKIIISGTINNKFTKIKPSLLKELGLEIVQQHEPLLERFANLEFYRINGTQIQNNKILTTILQKIQP